MPLETGRMGPPDLSAPQPPRFCNSCRICTNSKVSTCVPKLMEGATTPSLPDGKQPHWHSAVQKRSPRGGCEGGVQQWRGPPIANGAHLPGTGGRLLGPSKGFTASIQRCQAKIQRCRLGVRIGPLPKPGCLRRPVGLLAVARSRWRAARKRSPVS